MPGDERQEALWVACDRTSGDAAARRETTSLILGRSRHHQPPDPLHPILQVPFECRLDLIEVGRGVFSAELDPLRQSAPLVRQRVEQPVKKNEHALREPGMNGECMARRDILDRPVPVWLASHPRRPLRARGERSFDPKLRRRIVPVGDVGHIAPGEPDRHVDVDGTLTGPDGYDAHVASIIAQQLVPRALRLTLRLNQERDRRKKNLLKLKSLNSPFFLLLLSLLTRSRCDCGCRLFQ